MKITGFIVSFWLVFSTLATAQRHQFGLGVAYQTFEVEDAKTLGWYLSYLRPFGDKTYIGLSAEIANASGTDEMGADEKQLTAAGSLHFLYAAFQNDFQRLLLGGGISGRSFSDKWLIDENLDAQQSVFKPGLEILLDYNFFATENWVIGSRAKYQLYEKGNTVWTIGGSVGYRF